MNMFPFLRVKNHPCISPKTAALKTYSNTHSNLISNILLTSLNSQFYYGFWFSGILLVWQLQLRLTGPKRHFFSLYWLWKFPLYSPDHINNTIQATEKYFQVRNGYICRQKVLGPCWENQVAPGERCFLPS